MIRTAFLPILLLLLSIAPGLQASQEEAPGAAEPAQEAKGRLVIVGGGGTTEAIQLAALHLTGKEKPHVLILPQASGGDDRGLPSVEMWEKAGAGKVVNLVSLSERRNALRELEQADLIWLPGGSQLRLIEALVEADLVASVRQRFFDGAVVGGTSAGAAAMSEIVIEGAPEPGVLIAGAMQPHPGLGLWPGTILDQHFTARNRQARLLTAVLDHPEQLGIGIDERTAVIVEGHKLLVIGEGNVFVYDARQAQRAETGPGQRQGAMGVHMHVLREGMEWSW